MSFINNKNKFIYVLLIIAIISGFIWGFAYEKDPRPEISGSGEAYGYDQTALKILEKGLFSDDIKSINNDRLLYPIFLATIYKIFGHNYHIVTIIQIFIFIALSVLVYKLCQMVFNEKIAEIAGISMALCYSIASFSGWLSREVLFTFLVCFLIYTLYKAQITLKNRWFVVGGLIFGLSILTNAVIKYFILIILINLIIVCKRHYIFKDIYPKICIFFIAFAIIISPFFVSGQLLSGDGRLEALILCERAEKMERLDGKYWQHFVGNTLADFFAYKWFPDYNPREVCHGITTWNTYGEWVEQNKDLGILKEIFAHEAKEKIIKHPIMFLKQSSIDFLKFNTPMIPNMRIQHVFVGTHSNLSDFVKGSIILFIRFIYLLFFMLVIYGIITSIKYWSKVGWIILVILYFNAVFSVILAIARYSVPIYPFYIILASIGLINIWFKYKNENLLFN